MVRQTFGYSHVSHVGNAVFPREGVTLCPHRRYLDRIRKGGELKTLPEGYGSEEKQRDREQGLLRHVPADWTAPIPMVSRYRWKSGSKYASADRFPGLLAYSFKVPGKLPQMAFPNRVTSHVFQA